MKGQEEGQSHMRPFKKGLGEPQCVLGFQTLPNHTSSLPESEAREERTLGVGGGR